MKRLLIILVLASSVFSQPCQTMACVDSVLAQVFTMNGYTWPHPYDSNFSYDMNNRLTIKYHNLTTLPSNLFVKLRGMISLNLIGNSLTELPYDGLSDMPSLQEIRVDSNQLSLLPSNITMVSRLTYLGASNNQIMGFGPGMFTQSSFTAQVAFSNNLLGCNPAYLYPNQITYLNAHDINPDWRSTQDCNPVGVELHTEPSFKMSYSPNPFTTMTTLRYDLPGVDNRVHVAVYDVAGALVQTLFDGTQGRGSYSSTFSGSTAGIYFCKAVVNGRVYTHTLISTK